MITQAVCNSFKEELLLGVHDFDLDTFKMALFGSAATLTAATTTYSTSNEVSGSGYTAGGVALTGATTALTDSIAYADFNDAEWATVTIEPRGALIYNSSKANRAVVVLDFGETLNIVAQPFQVVLPTADQYTAIIRIR